MTSTWTPKRSLEECKKILTNDPQSVTATETVVVDGRVLKFYKRAPPVGVLP
jgi:hypothetical protein